jgi:hypothetical protein
VPGMTAAFLLTAAILGMVWLLAQIARNQRR